MRLSTGLRFVDGTQPESRPLRFGWQLAAATTALFALAAGCPIEHEQHEPSAAPPEAAAPPALAGYNFTPQQTSNIVANVMHDAHVDAAGIECQSCHRDPEEFLSHEAALALCMECHDEQIVALTVWENHCLSCHQFVKYKERYAESTSILRELCQDCHGEGSVIYRAFDPESPHDITCDNCHQPHHSAVVVAEGVCAGCHEEVTETTSPEKRVHGSCIVCHTPHSELPRSEELCGECHIATANILVHNVPEHPRNCLACHSAHFAATEIVGEACLVCHDDTYYGGRSNLPYAHQHCENCHYSGYLRYRGDEQCANCHEAEGETLSRAALPAEHRTCTACHLPHSWYTSFEQSCQQCHDVPAVIEHRLSFHQAACTDCHDPHHTELMAPSGHCDGCHGEGMFPNFRADLHEMHVECANCHSEIAIDSREFGFAGPEASCLLCHPEADAEQGLAWDDAPSGHLLCQACHVAHTFDTEPVGMRCDTCHRGVFGSFPSPAHGECFNCHQIGHLASFSAVETSCHVCHSEERAGALVEVKADCLICHYPHDFVADAASCVICHSELPAQATVAEHADCLLCHGDHTWRPGVEACSICHAEPPALHELHALATCTDCHALHSMAVDWATCRVCHVELAEHCAESGCAACHSFRAEE